MFLEQFVNMTQRHLAMSRYVLCPGLVRISAEAQVMSFLAGIARP